MIDEYKVPGGPCIKCYICVSNCYILLIICRNFAIIGYV